jgi:hypothetical protein
MKTRRLSKHQIIDLIISKAALGLFTGDKRDGKTPPITFQNFSDEKYRLAAKALRARLSDLSRAELLAEARAALKYHNMRLEWNAQYFARERRERQAELGRRPRLQPAILAAARYYRSCQAQGRKMYAGEAWRAIQKAPYRTSDGEIVIVDDNELRVQSRDRTQRRSPIKFAQWQKRYWVAAKGNSP